MEISISDVKEIQVTAVYFRFNPITKKLESYPKRIMVGDQEYTF
jgi:hypothetical protein